MEDTVIIFIGSFIYGFFPSGRMHARVGRTKIKY